MGTYPNLHHFVEDIIQPVLDAADRGTGLAGIDAHDLAEHLRDLGVIVYRKGAGFELTGAEAEFYAAIADYLGD